MRELKIIFLFSCLLLVFSMVFGNDFWGYVKTENDKKGLVLWQDAMAEKDDWVCFQALEKFLQYKFDSDELEKWVKYDAKKIMGHILFSLEKISEMPSLLSDITVEKYSKGSFLTAQGMLVDALINKGDLLAAKELQEKIFTLEEKKYHKTSFFYFGYFMFCEGKYKEALEYFEKAGNKSYHGDAYYFFKALTKYYLGDLNGSGDDNTEAGKQTKEHPRMRSFMNILRSLIIYKRGYSETIQSSLKGCLKSQNFDIPFLIRAREQELLEKLLPDIKEMEKSMLEKKVLQNGDCISPFIESKKWLEKDLKELNK